jgi:hypothetical protein
MNLRRLPERTHRFGILALLGKHAAQTQAYVKILRLQFQCLPVSSSGSSNVAYGFKNISESFVQIVIVERARQRSEKQRARIGRRVQLLKPFPNPGLLALNPIQPLRISRVEEWRGDD